MLRFIKKLTWTTALVLLAICLVASPAVTPAHANGGPPGIPHIFYGYAYIDGSLASTGKTIVGKVNGVQCGSTTVSPATGYNYQLQVSSSTGGTVEFYVDNVLATSTYPYSAGSYTPLNLYTYTTTLGVTTGSASSITSNSATLNGTLTGLGSSPTVYVSFEYGLSTSYGSTTPAQPMSSLGAFSAPITGLTHSTVYHFRAKVTDGGTIVNGSDAQFTTSSPVLTVSTGSASGVTTSTATLTGTLSDLGGSSTVSVSFEYGPTTSYGNTTTAQAMTTTNPFSATISGLSAGTIYHFRAKVVGGSTTAYGSDATFTTSSQSGGCTSGCCHWFWGAAYLNGSPVSGGSVAALVNGAASGASTTTNSSGGYNIYVPVTAGSTVTFTVNGIAAEGSTTASCMGYNGNYNLHTTSGTISVTTGSASYVSSTTATLNGTLSGLGTDTSATVSIEYGTTTSYGSTTTSQSMSSTGAFSGTATGLTLGTTYHYRAKAVGSPSGTIVYGSDATYVFGNTLAVTTGTGTYASSTTATLGGTLSSLGSDSSANVSFEYGTTTSYGSTTTAQSKTSTGAFSGTATGLTSGTTYHFRAKAVGSPSGTIVYGSDATYVHGNTLAVTTGAGSYVSSTSATLGGTLSSLGSDSSANVSFEYGTTTSYGSTTTAQSKTSTGAFSGTATGLISGTTYHFRAKAVGSPSGNTVYGSDATYQHTQGGDQIIGVNSSINYNADNGYTKDAFYLFQFPALKTASVVTMKVKTFEGGKIKMAIYSDVSGEPGVLLGSTTTEADVTSGGWRNVTISSTPLTSGNYYWLAWISSTIVVGNNYEISPRMKTRAQWGGDMNYTDFVFPADLGGSVFSKGTFVVPLIAGH